MLARYSIILMVFVLGCVGGGNLTDDTGDISDNVKILDDGTRYIIHPNKILGGGPPKDGIPSIDSPKFEKASDVNWLDDDDLVMGLDYKGVSRAYPFPVLVWHEIVNDEVAGDAVLITYCPLCQTGIAFDPTIDGETVEFGTSGKLYNSNLVMYDRKTDTYWTQVGGRAILGDLAGEELEMIPIDTVRWKDWVTQYPDTEVLSRSTGFSRDYTQDPYGNYYTSDSIIFPLDNRDLSLHPKAYVVGIDIEGEQKAYPEDVMKSKKAVNDKVGGKDLLVIEHPVTKAIKLYERDESSEFSIVDGNLIDSDGNQWEIGEDSITYDNKELSEIAGSGGFWFSWAAFYPETDVLES